MCQLFFLRRTIFLFVLFGDIQAQLAFNENAVDPDLLLDLDKFLEKHGYPVETHEIKTDDGYLLTTFRIPHGKNGTGVNPKPILMMHGLFGTAYSFVYAEYFNRSIATYFADHGYDVWLGNTRGNTYARKHVKLDPKNSKFWNFSWHEIGLHDLPSSIDYILHVTGRKKLYYMGHSQGGTIFYVLTSLRPEYQKKFAQVSLLAPGGLMGHFNNSAINTLAKYHRLLYRLSQNTDILEFPPSWLNLPKILFNLCVGTILQEFCGRILAGIFGSKVEEAFFPMIMNTLTSVSTMQALHYAQNIYKGGFRQWDYGERKNMQIYGKSEPPDYPVEKIRVAVTIYYGISDNVAFAGDQEDMCRRLKNCTMYKMPNPKWSHYDFIFSRNMKEELYDPMIKYMERFEI